MLGKITKEAPTPRNVAHQIITLLCIKARGKSLQKLNLQSDMRRNLEELLRSGPRDLTTTTGTVYQLSSRRWSSGGFNGACGMANSLVCCEGTRNKLRERATHEMKLWFLTVVSHFKNV